MANVKPTRFTVRRKRREQIATIVDQDGEVVALVSSKRVDDAHLLAAAPELLERLVEVRHLRKQADGKKGAYLLPPEAIAAIDTTLAHARGEKS